MTATTAAVVAVCTYEAAALVSGKAPPITSLCKRYRLLEVVLLAWLIVHLHHEAEEHRSTG